MLQCRRTIKYLLIVTISLSFCVMSGCIESMFYLAYDSRLPKWITLPPGLTRADANIDEEGVDPMPGGLNVRFVLRDKKLKKLTEVRGKSTYLSGRYFIVVVKDTSEIIGLTHQIDEHGADLPYFYVVDDLALKKEILDKNGIDDPALRKKLLDESGPPLSDP